MLGFYNWACVGLSELKLVCERSSKYVDRRGQGYGHRSGDRNIRSFTGRRVAAVVMVVYAAEYSDGADEITVCLVILAGCLGKELGFGGVGLHGGCSDYISAGFVIYCAAKYEDTDIGGKNSHYYQQETSRCNFGDTEARASMCRFLP